MYLCTRIENKPIMKKKNLITFLLLIWCAVGSWAQVSRLYTADHGLRTSSLRSVMMDTKGMVWVTGNGDLARFNGLRFQYLPCIDKKTSEPLFRVCNEIKQYDEDNYWVCTNNGFYMLHAKTDDFERIKLSDDENDAPGFAVNGVIDYIEQGKVLVTTDGYGIYIYDAINKKVESKLSRDFINLLGNAFVHKVYIDKSECLWASNVDHRLVYVDLKGHHAKNYQATDEVLSYVKNNAVEDIVECGDNIYFATSRGLLKYTTKNNTLTIVPGFGYYVKTILASKSGKLIVGTDGDGLWTLDPSTDIVTPYNDVVAPIEDRYSKVADMIEDEDGNLVCALYQRGLLVIPSSHDIFRYHAISPDGNRLNASSITSMAIDYGHNYWIATDGCGVFTTDGMQLATAHTVNEGLRSRLVQCVLVDKRGTAWAGSYGGGLQMYEGGMWTLGASGWLAPLSNEKILCTAYDEKDDIIYAASNGNGVYAIRPTQQSIEVYSFKSLKNGWIQQLFVDSDQTLWVSAAGSLCYYNKKTGKQDELHYEGKAIDGVSDINEYGDNILLASNEGLFMYNKKSKKLVLINKKDGMRDDHLRSIEVHDGYFWVSSGSGISSINAKTYEVCNYTSFTGYRMGEFHRNSSLQPGLGNILFGSDNGIICFTPKDIQNRKTELRELFFTRLRIGGENVEYDASSDMLDASIMYATKINLTHLTNSFTVTFSVPDVSDPSRIHYDYILEGFDKQWHKDIDFIQASYASLPVGSYTLKVIAYYEDNPSVLAEKEIRVVVHAPWYQSLPAILIYLLILAAVAYYLFKSWKERHEQKKLIKANEEQQSLKEAKLNMFTSITHELKSPLMMIESPLAQLMADDTDPERRNLYSVMQRNCNRLLDIVKQITDIRKIDAGQFEIKLEDTDYVEYANNVYEQFKGVAQIKNITFETEHQHSQIQMMLDRQHFEKIITNILSNAFKFTPAGGKVSVKSEVADNKVVLRFYNSGSHFNDEDREHLYERFYQGSAGNNSQGSGIGLNLVHELVKLHYGTIEAQNMEPDGVEFTLTFPYYNASINDSRPTLLYCDDDPEIVNYVRSQLDKVCNVVVAFSGNQGWKQVLQARPDVVVTDYQMPDGDGAELCQLIKTNPETENIPVIMVTGEGNDSLRLHSFNLQVDHYLEKPLNIMLLRSAILQVLKVRESMRNKARRTDVVLNYTNVEVVSAEDKLFAKINETIKKHLDDSEFGVQQLSEEVGISRVHLNRKMKERYGISPNVFIKSFRLKQAAYLLVHNKINVSEIAYKVGFSSHSYFSSSFHDYFSMSPSEFITFYSDPENEEAFQKLLE